MNAARPLLFPVESRDLGIYEIAQVKVKEVGALTVIVQGPREGIESIDRIAKASGETLETLLAIQAGISP